MNTTKKKKFKMPSSFTVLFILIILLAILTWIIPAGEYDVNKAGRYIAGTYHRVKSNPQSAYDVFMSPVFGMIGTKTTSAAIEVALFILVVGGFLGVLNLTGALDAGIAHIIKKNKGREKILIPLLMVLFALGGSTYGMAEETVAFYPLLIPIMIGVGFDTITSIGIILIGSQVGCLASTVNPFATGVASDTAGIGIAEGIIWRLIMLIVMTGISILYVYRYAAKIEKDPKKSLVYNRREQDLKDFKIKDNIPEMTKKQKKVIYVFLMTFVIMIISLIPWGQFNIHIFEKLNDYIISIPFIGNIFRHATPLGQWYFSEITMLFFSMSILIAFIYGIKEEEFIKAFMNGACDMISVALICGVSRGIQVIMNNGLITATVLHWGEVGLSGLSKQMFIFLTYIFYLPMSFLIPGTSSLAGATMGLLGPLGEFVGVPAHLVITAFQSASGVLNLVTPTSGVVMGALAIAHVDFTTWMKFTFKLMVSIIILSAAILVLASFFY